MSRKTKRNPNNRPAHWMPRVGDHVDYHSIIGEEPTSFDHVVRVVSMSRAGYPVAWISGKSDCVSVDLLTPTVRKREPIPRLPDDGNFDGGWNGTDEV
jgi:hypothetical protein